MYIDQDTGVMIHDKNNIIALYWKNFSRRLDYITPL